MVQRTGLVAFGTALGQLAVLGATPFLTRLYPPVAFGSLALLISVQSVVVVGGCLRYDLALPVVEETEVGDLLALCLAIGSLVTLLALVVGTAVWGLGGGGMAARLLAPPWLMTSLVLAVSVHQAVGSRLIRQGSFKALAALRASQGFAFALLAMVPFLGLSWGYALSFAPGCALLWIYRKALGSVSFGGMKAVLRRYAKFPTLSLPGALLDVTAYGASVWIISGYYGLGDAGQYFQVQRLIGGPMLLLSISLSQVMLKQTTDDLREGRSLRPLIRYFALILCGISTAAMLFLLVGGSWIMRKFLGPQWRVDTYFICLIAGTVFIRTIVSPLSSVLIATQRFHVSTLWQVAYFLSTVTVLPWLARHHGFDWYVAGYAVHEVVLYLIYFLVIYRCAGE